MSQDTVFSGISGAFWSLTFALIGLTTVVAFVGSDRLARALLAVMVGYSILGIAYGTWAARKAVLRSTTR